jgi:hypothetical protein
VGFPGARRVSPTDPPVPRQSREDHPLRRFAQRERDAQAVPALAGSLRLPDEDSAEAYALAWRAAYRIVVPE